MGQGASGIYSLLASKPDILNATSRRLPDGFYLVEVVATKEGPANARSGACFVMEFRVCSGPMAGQTFSTVPKLDKNPEAATRELVQFVAACEGRTQDSYTGANGAVDAQQLSGLIQRAFQGNANPYRGARVFVRAEKKTTKGGFDYVRHEWSNATETLARQHGFDWPMGAVDGNPGSAAPLPPQIPAMALPGAVPPPVAPMVPPALPTPAAPPPPAPPPVATGPRAVDGNPGWFLSVKFPGWWFSGPSEEQPTAFYDPSTGTTHRY